MKKVAGFNLVELLIALALSSILITVLANSFSSLNSSYLFTNNKLELNQDLRFSLELIKRDVQNAGVFGDFSFHNHASNAYTTSSVINPQCNQIEWCQFAPNTVGITSDQASLAKFPALATSLASDNISLASGSDILRIQFGGEQVAYLDPKDYQNNCISQHNCTINKCEVNNLYYFSQMYFIDQGLDLTRSSYFLASSNHGYLFSFAQSPFTNSDIAGRILLSLDLNNMTGCPNLTKVQLQAESVVAGATPYYNFSSFDPDMATMQLVNFYTRYYFVGTKSGISGLYVKTLTSTGQLSPAQLIAKSISQLNIEYLVESGNTNFNHYPNPNLLERYYTSSTINPADYAYVNSVIIKLTAQSNLAIAHGQQLLIQNQRDSVSWLR